MTDPARIMERRQQRQALMIAEKLLWLPSAARERKLAAMDPDWRSLVTTALEALEQRCTKPR